MLRSVLLALVLVTAVWTLPSFAVVDGNAPTSASTREEARIPFKASTDSDGTGVIMRVLGGFIVVALLALAVVYALKRYFPSFYVHSVGDAKRIHVLETRRLTPRTTLFVVEVDGTRLLLAQSGDRIVNLHKTSTSADANTTTPDL